MHSPPKPGAKRQDSAVSSASSGNRTVRANSSGGRRRSSISTSNAAGPGYLKDWKRGERPPEDNEEEDKDGDRVGVDHLGDETEVSLGGSSTPMAARYAGTTASEEDGAGPSDYWRRSPLPQGALTTLSGAQQEESLNTRPLLSQVDEMNDRRPAASRFPPGPPTPHDEFDSGYDEKSDGVQTDDDVYAKRLRLVTPDSYSLSNGALHHVKTDHDEEYFAASRRTRNFNKSQRYVTKNRAGLGLEDEVENDMSDDGEEGESVEFRAKVGHLPSSR